jgi:hypothetical protein
MNDLLHRSGIPYDAAVIVELVRRLDARLFAAPVVPGFPPKPLPVAPSRIQERLRGALASHAEASVLARRLKLQSFHPSYACPNAQNNRNAYSYLLGLAILADKRWYRATLQKADHAAARLAAAAVVPAVDNA